MTSEELRALFVKNDAEFLKFDRIPAAERRHARPDLCAFLLLAELFPGCGDMVSGAGHDEIFLETRAEFGEEWPLNEDQVIYLHRCGVRFSLEHDCFCMFV